MNDWQIEELVPLVKFFKEHGGYLDINSSEDSTFEISWSPFIGNGKEFMPKIFQKRVTRPLDFLEKCKKRNRAFSKLRTHDHNP